MQNFQLSIDFQQTARWLDRPARLGKQRLETADSLAMLLGQPDWMSDKQYSYIQKKYRNHPAWQMWKGYEPALIEYGLIICQEWIDIGYKDTYYDKILVFGDMLRPPYSMDNPPWLTEEFASNHRSILLGKVWENVSRHYPEWGYKEGLIVANKKVQKDIELWQWYEQWGWSEQPAKRVLINGKMRWLYLWPEVV